jgi:hypothetical protein
VSTGSPIGKAVMALVTLAVAGVLAVLSIVALPTASALGAVQAEPAATGPCVAVVVDFRKLGGAVQTGCAQGDPSSGLKALSLAGFSYRPRPDGLLCQIDSRPACTDTTSSRYWSYWYRAAGSSRWVYASEGPGTHNPKPGSTEGWVWQDGGRTPPPGTRADTICPQLAATPSPTPTKTKPTSKPTSPASKTPTSGKTHAPTSTPASAGAASAGRGSSGPTASPTTGSRTSSSGSPSSTSAAVAPPTDGSTSAATAPDPADQGGGSLGGAAGVALGSGVVLVIGAATVVRARRGRSP